MKIIFWGTPKYAIPCLDSIHNSHHEILAVVTQPDRRRGRGKKLIPSAVKLRANELGIRTFSPFNIKSQKDIQSDLFELKADLFFVVAFGQILPTEVLNQPPLGCWNSHASILPRWRGAAPIQWSVLKGDEYTGTAIMAMEEGLDTGPVLAHNKVKIGRYEDASYLMDRLSKLSAKLTLECLEKIEKVGICDQKQRYKRLGLISQSEMNNEVTYARQITKSDYLVNWNEYSVSIHRKILGLYPNAYTIINGKRLKLLLTYIINDDLHESNLSNYYEELIKLNHPIGKPGQIVAIKQDFGLIVSTADSNMLISQAQIEGKKPTNGNSLIQQLNIKVGEFLG